MSVQQKVKNAEPVGKVAILPRYVDLKPNDKKSVRSVCKLRKFSWIRASKSDTLLAPSEQRGQTLHADTRKTIRTAHLEQKNWKQEMNAFLRQYRATPHSTTDMSPSEALNGRKLQTLLPQHTEVNQSDVYNSIYENDSGKKRKVKEYADQRRHSKTSQIKVGDIVLIRQPKANIGFLRFKKFTCGP